MTRDAVETGLLIAKRRHQLNRDGGERQLGESRMRQMDLAALLGVASSTVANWERGKSYPGRYLGAVEALLGISLTGEPEDPERNKAMLHDSIDRMDVRDLAKMVDAYKKLQRNGAVRRDRAG